MDGAHDMGGVAWSGPVQPEPNEPVFHAAWERRAFAITLAMAMPGGWNIDMSRFAREDRPAEDVSCQELLSDLDRRARTIDAGKRSDRFGGNCRRQVVASSQTRIKDPEPG